MYQQLRAVTVTTKVSGELDFAQERSMSLQPRMVWLLYYIQKRNVLLVCQKFCISRKTFYKWLKRYRDSGGDPSSLVDLPRTPHHFPRAIAPEVVSQIIQARRETGYGQRRLKKHLAQNCNIKISEHTIWKLLKKSQNHKTVHPNSSRSLRDPVMGEESNKHRLGEAAFEEVRQ